MFRFKRNQIIQHFLLTLGQGHVSLRSDGLRLLPPWDPQALGPTKLGEKKERTV